MSLLVTACHLRLTQFCVSLFTVLYSLENTPMMGDELKWFLNEGVRVCIFESCNISLKKLTHTHTHYNSTHLYPTWYSFAYSYNRSGLTMLFSLPEAYKKYGSIPLHVFLVYSPLNCYTIVQFLYTVVY